tara:strand:- start:1611 stop:2237 length:627 start_codon:yes stop_codon:yes gene_type:complete
MPTGDIHILKKIEKADRRANKAAKRVAAALAKTSRNKRKSTPIAVMQPTWPALSFADEAHIITNPNMKAVSRRLRRKKVGKHRVFSVGEVLEGLETVACLLVVPRQVCATIQELADSACKEEGAEFAVSESRVLLFHTRSSSEKVTTGGIESTHIFLRKVTLRGAHPVFYACAENLQGECSPPRALHLDKEAYGRIQRSVAGMVGVHI